jgi:hypothetical protein
MTASWADGECSVAVHQPQHQQRKQKKKAAEAAQVVAVLFAVRVGYKLARSGGFGRQDLGHRRAAVCSCLMLPGAAHLLPAPLLHSWQAAV